MESPTLDSQAGGDGIGGCLGWGRGWLSDSLTTSPSAFPLLRTLVESETQIWDPLGAPNISWCVKILDILSYISL